MHIILLIVFYKEINKKKHLKYINFKIIKY